MVLTRDIREEIKSVVSQSIKSILNDDQVKRIIEKVVDGVTKTIEERFGRLEQKIETTITENSTVIADIKEEAAILKSENEYLLKAFDDMDQQIRSNNLRIFNLRLVARNNQVLSFQADVPIEKEEIVACSRIGKRLNNRPRSVLIKLANVNFKQRIY
nr:unnamed protein product [Callosobruchus analis]